LLIDLAMFAGLRVLTPRLSVPGPSDPCSVPQLVNIPEQSALSARLNPSRIDAL